MITYIRGEKMNEELKMIFILASCSMCNFVSLVHKRIGRNKGSRRPWKIYCSKCKSVTLLSEIKIE